MATHATSLLGRLFRLWDIIWYLLLSAFFFEIIFDLTAFDHFMHRLAFAFLVIEFITIHSSGFIFGTFMKDGKVTLGKKILGVLMIYGLFSAAAALIAQSILLFLYFWFNTFMRILEFNKGDNTNRQTIQIAWAVMTCIFLLSPIFSVIVTNPLLIVYSSYSGHMIDSMSWHKIAVAAGDSSSNVSGSPPITIAVWMFTYFSMLSLAGIYHEAYKLGLVPQVVRPLEKGQIPKFP